MVNDEKQYSIPTLTCLRCGHTWHPRSARRPNVCPYLKCKSPYWSTPRKPKTPIDKPRRGEKKKEDTMKSAVRTTDVSWSYKEYDVVGTPTARDVRGKRTDAYDWLYEVRDASGRRLHEGYFKSLEASMQFIDAIVRGND